MVCSDDGGRGNIRIMSLVCFPRKVVCSRLPVFFSQDVSVSITGGPQGRQSHEGKSMGGRQSLPASSLFLRARTDGSSALWQLAAALEYESVAVQQCQQGSRRKPEGSQLSGFKKRA